MFENLFLEPIFRDGQGIAFGVAQDQKSVWRQYLQQTELNGVIYLDEGNGQVATE